jgi:hypothetical protein
VSPICAGKPDELMNDLRRTLTEAHPEGQKPEKEGEHRCGGSVVGRLALDVADVDQAEPII